MQHRGSKNEYMKFKADGGGSTRPSKRVSPQRPPSKRVQSPSSRNPQTQSQKKVQRQVQRSYQPQASRKGQTQSVRKAQPARGVQRPPQAQAKNAKKNSANSQSFKKSASAGDVMRGTVKKAGIVIGAVLVVYIALSIVFSIWIVPNTKLGVFDISLKTSEDIEKTLNDALRDYNLNVSGDGFSFSASASDAKIRIDTQATVDAIHQELSGWAWPILLVSGPHDVTNKMYMMSDSNGVISSLTEELNKFNESATAPVSANISYSPLRNKFDIVEEQLGTELDVNAITKAAAEAIAYLQPQLTLDENYLAQPAIKSDDKRITQALKQADTIASCNISLLFDTVVIGAVPGSVLASMVVLDDNCEATIDSDRLKAWVADLAARTNTAGSTRTYNREGVELTVSGGVYGWEIDQPGTCEAIIEAAKEGKSGQIDTPCLSKGAVYTAPGQRDWGTKYLDVDISEQYVRFFGDDGSIIWESECITGTPNEERQTVQGVWYVTDKETNYTLVGYAGNVAQYETKVAYWMPFEGNAIGFHDATWQPGFGGELYMEGYGSHGCVNLPYSKAQSLYSLISIRDVVVVHE